MAQVAGGDFLDETAHARLDRTILAAEQRCRFEFSVFVGAVEGDPRAYATSLHNSLVVPSRSVMIVVDPDQRLVEVVTGGTARERLTDTEVRSAVQEMVTLFAAGDLLAGLERGIDVLSEDARD